MNDNYKRKLQALALASTIMLSLTGCKDENDLSEINNDEIKYQQEETKELNAEEKMALGLLSGAAIVSWGVSYSAIKEAKKYKNEKQINVKVKKRTK